MTRAESGACSSSSSASRAVFLRCTEHHVCRQGENVSVSGGERRSITHGVAIELLRGGGGGATCPHARKNSCLSASVAFGCSFSSASYDTCRTGGELSDPAPAPAPSRHGAGRGRRGRRRAEGGRANLDPAVVCDVLRERHLAVHAPPVHLERVVVGRLAARAPASARLTVHGAGGERASNARTWFERKKGIVTSFLNPVGHHREGGGGGGARTRHLERALNANTSLGVHQSAIRPVASYLRRAPRAERAPAPARARCRARRGAGGRAAFVAPLGPQQLGRRSP